ncbi:MAG: SDR family NAD(P)-dependent oxidoreductase, partial [Gemmatimonadales bacterium]
PADPDGASEVALRAGGSRWVRDFAPGGAPNQDQGTGPEGRSPAPAVPDEPVVLITGGFGGVGLELARHLAARQGARLALLGRTPLPEREAWEGLEARGADPRVIRGLGVVRELEARGAQVLPLAADVTDEEALTAARDRIREVFGEVDVVIHAAGVLDDALVPVTTEAAAGRVLAPKVRGTEVLERVFRDPAPARILLFSSVSAEAGLPGQVDYASANAFLDAVARSRFGAGAPGARVTSVGWSAWSETGMAVDPVKGLGAWPPLQGPEWRRAREPVFDAAHDAAARVRVRLREGRLWMLDEHRTREGTPLVPGAGYLELVAAAARELGRLGEGDALRLEEIFFLSPFAVPVGETREMELRLPEGGGQGEFTVLGRGRPDEEWTEHVRGRMAVDPAPEVDETAHEGAGDDDGWTPVDGGGSNGGAPRQDLALGPRWSNVAEMAVRPDPAGNGDGGGVLAATAVAEVLLTLELPAEHRHDLEVHRMHPALLDNATALAGPLLPGFGEEGSVYVPASYGSFTLYRPLPARFRSRIRRAEGVDEGSDELSVLDVTLMDEAGRVLAEARQFVLVRLDADDMAQEQIRAQEEREARRQAVAQAAARGMPTRIGLEIVDHLLRDPAPPAHVLVSPGAPAERIAELREAALGAGARKRGGAAALVDVASVEAALQEMEAVSEAAVTAHEDRPGEVRLVAHVVMDPQVFATVSELRRELRRRLDPELVPQNFIQLDALPRNRKGKVLRSELRDPFAPVDDYVAPETPTQEAIARIWRDLLGAQQVGLHDNFLDVGGHSLLAMRAILRMEKATGVRVGPIQMNMFTLEQIAAHIESEGGGAAGEAAQATEAQATEAEAAGATEPDEPTEVPQGEICVGPRPAQSRESGPGDAPAGEAEEEKKGFLSKVR